MRQLIMAGIIIILCCVVIADAKEFTATRIRGEWLPASAIRGQGGTPAVYTDIGVDGAWEFADNAERDISFNMRIPTTINTTALTPYFHIGWSSPTISENACWQLMYTVTAIDDDTTLGPEVVLTQYEESSATANGIRFITFNITGINAGDVCIHCRIIRYGNNASDNLSDVAHVHGLCLSYAIDIDYETSDALAPSYAWTVAPSIFGIIAFILIITQRRRW